jgi:hypothetical protein
MKRFVMGVVAGGAIVVGATAAIAGSGNYRTHLTNDEEVSVIVTGAQGQATFQLSADGTSLGYKLNTSSMESVVQAHIHLGPAGANGPVVTFLFGPVAGGVDNSGRLASGSIEAGDLIGPLAGQPLSALVDAIESGNAYVNVHTMLNPAGEIRGQL